MFVVCFVVFSGDRCPSRAVPIHFVLDVKPAPAGEGGGHHGWGLGARRGSFLCHWRHEVSYQQAPTQISGDFRRLQATLTKLAQRIKGCSNFGFFLGPNLGGIWAAVQAFGGAF